MQKHIHTSKVIGGVIDFLTEKPFFDDVIIKLFFRL